jgi:hypothetical protein
MDALRAKAAELLELTRLTLSRRKAEEAAAEKAEKASKKYAAEAEAEAVNRVAAAVLLCKCEELYLASKSEEFRPADASASDTLPQSRRVHQDHADDYVGRAKKDLLALKSWVKVEAPTAVRWVFDDLRSAAVTGVEQNDWLDSPATFSDVVCARDGHLYCIPFGGAQRVLRVRVDARERGAQELDSVGDSLRPADEGAKKAYERCLWGGGVLGGDGRVYGVPFDADAVLRVDPRVPPADAVTLLPMPAVLPPGAGGGKMLANRWSRGALEAHSGIIFCAPYNARRVLAFDPATQQAALVGPDLGCDARKYCDVVQCPHSGKLYFIPCSAADVLVLSPGCASSSSEAGFIRTAGLEHAVRAASGVSRPEYLWSGAVVAGGTSTSSRSAAQSCIYCVPCGAEYVLKINTVDGTAQPIGTSTAVHGSVLKWRGGVLAHDGKIYCTPFNSSVMLVIDPATDTTSTLQLELEESPGGGGLLAPPTGMFKWCGAAVAHNGAVYLAPWNARGFACLGPASLLDAVARPSRAPDPEDILSAGRAVPKRKLSGGLPRKGLSRKGSSERSSSPASPAEDDADPSPRSKSILSRLGKSTRLVGRKGSGRAAAAEEEEEEEEEEEVEQDLHLPQVEVEVEQEPDTPDGSPLSKPKLRQSSSVTSVGSSRQNSSVSRALTVTTVASPRRSSTAGRGTFARDEYFLVFPLTHSLLLHLVAHSLL